MITKATLTQMVRDIDKLQSMVEQAYDFKNTNARLLPAFRTCTIPVVMGDYSTKHGTFFNGGPDLYVLGMSAGVYVSQPTSGLDNPQLRAAPLVDAGPMLIDQGGGSETINPFNFAWDFMLNRSGFRYFNVVNGAQFLASRRSLGVKERGMVREFSYPLLLEAGESITFDVQPLYFGVNGIDNDHVSAGQNLDVMFFMYGFLTNELATPSYEVK